MTHKPFDATLFKVDTLIDHNLTAETLITSVPVHKPTKQQFIRVHPGVDYHYDTALLEDEQDRELYLVANKMLPYLEGEYRLVRLCMAIPRNGSSPFLWPLKLPSADGRSNLWNESALLAASEAKKAWVRVIADQQQSMYRTMVAKGKWEEPDWPDVTMTDLLEKAFDGKVITDETHPIVAKLRGEI